jgi:PIN domain nuclease of toxin-antitoxin system
MILDTCAVLWFAFERAQLTDATIDTIEHSDSVRISTLSFWEIGINVRKKKLVMPIGVDELAQLFIRNESVELVAPDIGIVSRALELEWPHRDPIDRMIVATALKYDDWIATGDTAISSFYPKTMR